MIKLKLKRKISGKRIRKDKRQKEFHPTYTQSWKDADGNIITQEFKQHVRYENKGIYRKNKPKKRHVENPNIYEGEEHIKARLRDIRIPKSCRKTAWKRFSKAFPYVKVTRTGGRIYVPLQEENVSPLNPQPKKKF